MEAFDRHSAGGQPFASRSQQSYWTGREKAGSRPCTPKAYRLCDGLTGGLICFMVVFTPWAFGTTQNWSIWTMNITGFTLSAILLAKWLVRWQYGYRPARWGGEEVEASEPFQIRQGPPDLLTPGLAILTVLILAYTLVGALNARATYLEWERRFDYRDCVNWLPHSYDSSSTWRAFWMYLGLACFFWATRDWLLGKSGRERRRHRKANDDPPALASATSRLTTRELVAQEPSASDADHRVTESASRRSSPRLPARLSLLLWVLCINASILALEAILQRLSGTNKLLWIKEPWMDKTALLQFGPYAYRANAASYFNLMWPVCLGFWLVLRQSAKPSLRAGHRFGSGSYLVLLPGAVLMAACPVISTTRGGAIVAVASLLATVALLLWSTRKESPWFRLGACLLFAVILGLAAFLGLKDLVPRLQTIFTDHMSQRLEIYKNARPMAQQFPVLGTGPGSFSSLYQLYREDATQVWQAYVHDDWLETRITFGWVGFGIILLMLGAVVARWSWGGGGIPVPWQFAAMIWVALGGCLLHGKFDFPFQIYSIVLLFLLLCAILFCVSNKPATP